MQNAPYLHVWNYNQNSDSYTISAGKPNTIVLCVQDVISKILYGSLSSFHWAPSGLQVVLRRFSTENDLVRLLVTNKKNHELTTKKLCKITQNHRKNSAEANIAIPSCCHTCVPVEPDPIDGPGITIHLKKAIRNPWKRASIKYNSMGRFSQH